MATKQRKAHTNGVIAQGVAFAMCRSMGHEWHHQPAIGSDDAQQQGFRVPFGGSYGMVGLPSTCHQCGTERMRWISRTGESHVRYHHPDGYAQHGDDKLTPTQWRMAYVSTIFDSFITPRKATARASG